MKSFSPLCVEIAMDLTMELDQLETTIQYAFNDRSLLELALTHPSWRHEHQLTDDNQRLEYLGDAVLGLVTAEYLYHRHPGAAEGKLTKWRSAATSTTALSTIARSVKLGAFFRLGRGEETSGGREKENNLADALEALIGAVYLDGGYQAAQQLFHVLFQPTLETMESMDGSDNPKGHLQEWTQKNGIASPVYEVITEEGPPHQRWFTIKVQVPDQPSATGNGPTKKSAEADAARNMLAVLNITPI